MIEDLVDEFLRDTRDPRGLGPFWESGEYESHVLLLPGGEFYTVDDGEESHETNLGKDGWQAGWARTATGARINYRIWEESPPRLEADHPLHWQVMTTPINDWANTMEMFATAYWKSDKPSFISVLLIHK